MHDETLAIHGSYTPDSTRAVAVPIYQTVAHEFTDADHAGAIMDLETPGFHYNRINNPTVDVLEQRLTALEGGVGAMAVSSGSAAVSMSVLNLLSAGDNLVSVPQLYGATYTYFAHVLPRLGVEVRFAADDRPDSIAARIDERTKAVFCETVGNPAGNVIDLTAVAEVAHARGVPVIADNTVATPFMLKPFRHGADVVIHSLTKFIGGHGTTLGGIIIDGGTFPWADHPDRFKLMVEPEPAFHGVRYAIDFADTAYVTRCRTIGLRNTGASLSPFNAFLLLQGLETLAVRLPRHEANTRAVASFLASDPRVSSVSFLGFADNPYHELGRRYLGDRVPSIMTFTVHGGRDAGIAVFNQVKLFKRLLNMGDAKSLITHPASTTHRQLTPDDLKLAGITPDMVRLSVGLEHPDDLIEDLDQALAVAAAG
ncbi:MAG: O-acetylhomoserine aminocarboxypropyltransferase/cysteine synthase [Solirubrobacterales bacterium]|nr:O-acetylhomoserine aminocarboxypropyltransferase/cysteine synthase [Solirubrobacterales bacterium]